MYRIQENTNHLIEIDKSKFITYLYRVFNEQEAKDYIHSIQKVHPDANHHCYAFIIGKHNEIQRSNDNGEPSGTAGVPMLESLKKNNMQDTLAVCVRYFGGIKLGAGGLIRAYSKSVSQAIQNTTLSQTIMVKRYQLLFSYDYIGKLDYFFSQNKITILNKEYESDVIYTYQTSKDILKELSEITSGKYLPTFIMEEIIEEIINKK